MNDSTYTEGAAASAKAKGLVIHVPADNELFVDIDDAASIDVFWSQIGKVGALVTSIRIDPSPSGREGRRHIRVTLNRPVESAFERILLQALVGSDRTHEIQSFRCAVRGDKNPTRFFEKPAKVDP